MKTNKTAESPPTSAADGAPADAGTGQYRPEQSPPEIAGEPASGRTGRPVRGGSLGYATAHLGSASVAGLGAIGSAYGLGGVAVAGGLLAGGAASAYVARRVTRVGGRRAAGGGRSASRTPADGTKARRRGGRAGGLLGRGGRAGLMGRRAAAGRAVGGGARSATRKGLLNGGAHGGAHGGGRGGLLGSRRPVTGGHQPAGLPGTSRRAGTSSSGPGRTGLFGGSRSAGKGLVGGQSRSGGQGVLGGKRSGGAGGGAGSTGKTMTGRGSRSWSKGWKSLFGSGDKNKSAKKVKNRGKSSEDGGRPQAPTFVDNADPGTQPVRGNDKQVPDSRRQRGASTGGKNMGHVSDSAETIVTAIAKADISSARKLDAVFDDLAGFEARVAAAKRHLAARIAEEFPADPSISEHVSQSAGLQARLGETLGELRRVFHRAHAMEWERLDSPRRNEHAWDVTHNQD